MGCPWPHRPGLSPWLPVAALTGVLGESMLSRWMDLGRPRLCLAPPPGRGLMTLSMSSISFSCFLLRYSCLMKSFLALSSSFLIRSSSAFSLNRQRIGRKSVQRNTVCNTRTYTLKINKQPPPPSNSTFFFLLIYTQTVVELCKLYIWNRYLALHPKILKSL